MSHVDDQWWRRDPLTGDRIPTGRNGQGRRWLARYVDPAGRRRAQAFDRKVEADQFLATVETDKLRGSYVDPHAGRTTVKTYGEEWFAAHVVRDQTADLYGSHLKNHVYPALGDKPLGTVKRSDIQAFVKGLQVKGLAPATVAVVYGITATIFRAAVEDEKLTKTPCRGIALPERFAARVVPLNRGAALALPSAVGERFAAAVWLGLGAGLRQGEVFGLQVDRVDMLRRQVRIGDQHGQLVVRKGGPRIRPPKTKSSARTVPLPDVVLDALAEHIRRFPSYDRHADGCDGGRCADDCLYGLVFTGMRGGPLRRSVFNPHVWVPAVKTAGLPKGTGFHELRHFYASVLIDGGESVKVVQERLGHKDATETLNTYAHLWPASDDHTRAVVEAALRPAVSGDEDAKAQD